MKILKTILLSLAVLLSTVTFTQLNNVYANELENYTKAREGGEMGKRIGE